MLIIALLGAFIFYIVLYLIWDSATTRLDSVSAILASLNKMMWVSPNTTFTILRGVLFLATCYVVFDLFFSAAKRATRRRENDAKTALSWKNPPPPVDPSTDLE